MSDESLQLIEDIGLAETRDLIENIDRFGGVEIGRGSITNRISVAGRDYIVKKINYEGIKRVNESALAQAFHIQ